MSCGDLKSCAQAFTQSLDFVLVVVIRRHQRIACLRFIAELGVDEKPCAVINLVFKSQASATPFLRDASEFIGLNVGDESSAVSFDRDFVSALRQTLYVVANARIAALQRDALLEAFERAA